MDLTYFPHFMRKNYPEVSKEPNEDLAELGARFKEYLEKAFDGRRDKLEAIWDISPKTVIMNEVNKVPFKVNGYHPALVLHFEQFVKKMREVEK